MGRHACLSCAQQTPADQPSHRNCHSAVLATLALPHSIIQSIAWIELPADSCPLRYGKAGRIPRLTRPGLGDTRLPRAAAILLVSPPVRRDLVLRPCIAPKTIAIASALLCHLVAVLVLPLLPRCCWWLCVSLRFASLIDAACACPRAIPPLNTLEHVQLLVLAAHFAFAHWLISLSNRNNFFN